MSQCVHSRRSSDPARQVDCQFRIQQRAISHQISADNALFGAQLLQAEHGDVRDFAAGARGGRDKDLGQSGFRHLFDTQVILGLAAVGGDDRSALSGIDGATATQPDDQVDALAGDEPRTSVDAFDTRIGFDIAPDLDVGTGEQ